MPVCNVVVNPDVCNVLTQMLLMLLIKCVDRAPEIGHQVSYYFFPF